jgi:hypothetical protein
MAAWSDLFVTIGRGIEPIWITQEGTQMAVLNGVDEAGAFTLYDVPDAELAKYKLNTKPLTDEIRNKLFPGKDAVTKDDAQGVIPAGRSSGGGGDVEGYAAWCWYYLEDGDGDWVYWEDWC